MLSAVIAGVVICVTRDSQVFKGLFCGFINGVINIIHDCATNSNWRIGNGNITNFQAFGINRGIAGGDFIKVNLFCSSKTEFIGSVS